MSKAFTLIELLVVMAIIVLLGSMVMAFVTIGQEGSDINATRAVVYTVGTTIKQFTHETGSLPLPQGSASDPHADSWYPTELNGAWDKQQLWWRLNHKMTPQERSDMRDAGIAADKLANPYQSEAYMKALHPATSTRYNAIKSILDSVDNTEMEQYRLKNVSGWTYTNSSGDIHDNASYTSVRGKYKIWALEIRAAIAKDLAERAYMCYPCLDDEDINTAVFLQDQCVVDAWGSPLIYVARSTPAVKENRYNSNYQSIGALPAGRVEITDRNNDGQIDRLDWSHAPDVIDQIDHDESGAADEKDWGNILYNAFPGNGLGFFLASAGPDSLFHCLVAETQNDDNIVMDLE